MNSVWQTFLEQTGAITQNGQVRHFGDLKAELASAAGSPVVADLSHLGMIQISGADAGNFLHTQLSCDVENLALNSSVYGSYCSPKGRMLANFLLWRSGNGYFMALSHSLLPAIQKRLTMFVLRSKVELSDVSDLRVLLGMAGPGLAALLATTFADVPRQDHCGCADDQGLLLRLPLARWIWVTDPESAQGKWPRLMSALKPIGTPAWQWLEIQAGIPWITAPTQEQFVPQMANLDLIGGVSFDKGCYPGQEIVARTKYLGKLKRRMYLANVRADALPEAGTSLYNETLGDQASGMVVNAQASPSGGYDLLAVTQIDSVTDASQVRLGSPQGPALTFQPLPYPVA
jgi:folate-binding protein YgfZ